MSLNIKDEETHRMAQELAALTGQSMSAAVTEALREKLQRVKSKGMAERIIEDQQGVLCNVEREAAPRHR